jgi:Ni/Co efflux regulator RcnB
MRLTVMLLALIALATPSAAFANAQPGEGQQTSDQQANQDQTSDQQGVLSGNMAGVQLAARVVRRVGPRGRVRTFVYRGRPVNRFRARRFVYPRGFAYRRWAIGALLPAALIAAPFYFSDYDALGLRRPPPGYRWVRYGPDVVLVNERTREVEDVAYGAIDEDDDDDR